MPADPNSIEITYAPGVDAKWALGMSRFADTESTTSTTSSRRVCSTTLKIEQTIANCLQEHAPNVIRVVHTFGGRDIHLKDGSRIEYRWQLHITDYRCLDCRVDTDALDEYYMLHNQIWAQAHPDIDGNLCISCVEARLGRKLTAADFSDAQVNSTDKLRRSPRLSDRLSTEL